MTDKIKTPKKMGRPPAFTTAEELWLKCKEYFDTWEEIKRPVTVTGLATYLDVHIDTLNFYETGIYDTDLNDFSATIKKAKQFIATDKWEKLLTGEYKAAGAIFDLKNNHGARDTIEHLTKDGESIAPSQTIVVTEATIKSVVKQVQDDY